MKAKAKRRAASKAPSFIMFPVDEHPTREDQDAFIAIIASKGAALERLGIVFDIGPDPSEVRS